MIIDNTLLDKLSEKAKASPRLRLNYDLRNTENDNSQRMLNAMEPGTILPIHRHANTTETIFVLRGTLREIYYDGKGNATQTILLQAEGPNRGVCVPQGTWHSSECLSHGTILLVCKDGKYAPQKDEDLLHPIEHPAESFLKQEILDYLDVEMRSMQAEMVSVSMLLYHLGEGIDVEAVKKTVNELQDEGKVRVLPRNGVDYLKLV